MSQQKEVKGQCPNILQLGGAPWSVLFRIPQNHRVVEFSIIELKCDSHFFYGMNYWRNW